MFYDCSFPTTNYTNPPVWPYTLDQGFQHVIISRLSILSSIILRLMNENNCLCILKECAIPPCPESKYPGIWTVPMVSISI